jgi:DNA-binding MarR family transcriptional regulator
VIDDLIVYFMSEMWFRIVVNAGGYRIGEDHPKAKLTNYEVELLIGMYEEGNHSLRQLAKVFDISKSQVRNIVTGLKRAQLPERFKTVHLSVKK